MASLKQIDGRTFPALRALGAYNAREKALLLDEMVQVEGLMPLLMKPRNRQRWTAQDKADLSVRLKCLSKPSPYRVVLGMPGGFFMLPVLAWWLDRRRHRSARSSARRRIGANARQSR